MNMTLQVRPAESTDAPAICALLHSVTHLMVPEPTAPDAIRFLDSSREPAVIERLAAPNFRHLVAERDGKFCGYIAMRDGSHLYHLFVRPELHGQGIARFLWQQILSGDGPGRYTVNSSVPAVGVYRNFGFVTSGEPQLHCHPPYVPMMYTAGE